MLWFISILILFFCLMLWLPIRLEVDTEEQIYKAEWSGIFSFWGMPEEKGWRWFLKLFFWQIEWKKDVSQPKKEAAPKQKDSNAPKRKKKFSLKMVRAMLKHLLNAVRVQHLRVNWDTGDFVLNAWLYPAFRMASQGNRQLSINFLGEQALAIRLQTRLGVLAIAAMRIFINLKNF